ncbi:MAG: DMT family protein [Planctomycetota bacterium]
MTALALPIVLLVVSNIFMTFAWYGHLKFKASPLWLAVMASWGIAFVEYCFQVPANRMGHAPEGPYTAAQLKTIQEIITLAVFAVFSVLYLKEGIRWNVVAGFALIVAAAFLIFKK